MLSFGSGSPVDRPGSVARGESGIRARRVKLLLGHPLGFSPRFEPFDDLIQDAELPHPSRAWQTLPCGLVLGVGVWSARSEVHDLPLVHPEHGVHAAANQQRQMSERAEASVGNQDVARLERRWRCTTWAISWVRSGVATASSNRPVPAWNTARILATGNPHPGF